MQKLMQKFTHSNKESCTKFSGVLFAAALILSTLSGCKEEVAQSSDESATTNSGEQLNPPMQTDASKPNLLIIMADDLGFSDLGAFGGEISTPNLDELARSGVQMVNFYSSLTCSPSRAMLMSGADNHLIGLGNMDETLADNQIGLPGYEGILNNRVVNLAEALQGGGYNTYMAGKWHLGLKQHQGPAARGFDESFALLFGGASHYDNSFGPDEHRTEALYRNNGKLLNKAPQGFFSSAFYTDQIIENIENGAANGKPFFAYLSFTAPHWPLQFPPGYQGKYAQTYQSGWHAIREQRLAKLKELGLLAESDVMAPLLADWNALSSDEQAMSARSMEIYAAMVDDMDANIGRLLNHLKKTGLYENTVVVFLSDNGASTWGNNSAPPVVRDWANTFNNSYENAGQPDSYILYGKQWGAVSNTPYKHGKGNASEGGIRVPVIVRLPSHPVESVGPTLNKVLAGIEDIMPTFLELAGIDTNSLPEIENRVPITGLSLLPAVSNPNHAVGWEASKARIVGRELWGKQGMRVGDWKLVNQPPPTGTSEWQLFNLKEDLAEQVDLADAQPEKLADMLRLWQQYVDYNNVVLPEGKFRVRETGPLPTE